jgi:BMFP domain-containing protein YqiC
MRIPSVFIRRVAAAIPKRGIPTAHFRAMTTSYNPKEIEAELKAKHEKALHALDDSQGDFDIPKTPKQMQELHDLYHRINELESDLAEVKGMLRDAKRTFAVDAPDGESDGHIQEELEEIKHIIDDSAPKH